MKTYEVRVMAKYGTNITLSADSPADASNLAKAIFGKTWTNQWGEEQEFDSVDMIYVEEV